MQGGLSVVYVCVIKKHGWLLSYRSKIATNWLSTAQFVIYIIRKMPTKLAESSVECYFMGF